MEKLYTNILQILSSQELGDYDVLVKHLELYKVRSDPSGIRLPLPVEEPKPSVKRITATILG